MDLIPNKNSTNTVGNQNFQPGNLGSFGSGAKGRILGSQKLSEIGGRFFKLSIILVIVFLLAGGVFYLWGWWLNRQVEQNREVLDGLVLQLQGEDFQNYKSYTRQTEGLKNVLKQKVFASNLLATLEKNTVAGNFWNSLELNVSSGECRLTGKAGGYSDVAKQAVALKTAGFSEIEFEKVQISKTGGVDFQVSFVFSESLKKKASVALALN